MGIDLQKKDPETYAIIGAAMTAHRELGSGFLEAIYHEAMEIELEDQQIAFVPQMQLKVKYKTRTLKAVYKADFICFGDIIVEIKALSHELTGTERSQVINYLKATGFRRALLINFGMSSLKYERIVLGPAEEAE